MLWEDAGRPSKVRCSFGNCEGAFADGPGRLWRVVWSKLEDLCDAAAFVLMFNSNVECKHSFFHLWAFFFIQLNFRPQTGPEADTTSTSGTTGQ